MKSETKEKLKEAGRELANAALKEGVQAAREELPGLFGRFVAWVRKRRAAKRAKR